MKELERCLYYHQECFELVLPALPHALGELTHTDLVSKTSKESMIEGHLIMVALPMCMPLSMTDEGHLCLLIPCCINVRLFTYRYANRELTSVSHSQ